MRKALKIALALLVLGGATYLFAFPARTYWAQERSIAIEQREASALRAEDQKLAAESASLQTNATIEQIARQDYGLVEPGQQAFTVLPPANQTVRSSAKTSSAGSASQSWYSPLEFWRYL
jgi:cell division protein FtsB